MRKQRQKKTEAPTPAELRRWVVVGRGPNSTFARPGKGAPTLGDLADALKAGRRPVVELDSDVASVFGDSKSVNNALRKLIEAVPATALHQRRKSA